MGIEEYLMFIFINFMSFFFKFLISFFLDFFIFLWILRLIINGERVK